VPAASDNREVTKRNGRHRRTPAASDRAILTSRPVRQPPGWPQKVFLLLASPVFSPLRKRSHGSASYTVAALGPVDAAAIPSVCAAAGGGVSAECGLSLSAAPRSQQIARATRTRGAGAAAESKRAPHLHTRLGKCHDASSSETRANKPPRADGQQRPAVRPLAIISVQESRGQSIRRAAQQFAKFRIRIRSIKRQRIRRGSNESGGSNESVTGDNRAATPVHRTCRDSARRWRWHRLRRGALALLEPGFASCSLPSGFW
jgi:hypothetical protein